MILEKFNPYEISVGHDISFVYKDCEYNGIVKEVNDLDIIVSVNETERQFRLHRIRHLIINNWQFEC